MKKYSAAIALVAMLMMLVSPLPSFAEDVYPEGADCGRDPIYTRDFYARPTIGLRVRSIACMEGSTVLGMLETTKSYRVIAETDGWYKVKMDDGTVGWSGSALMVKTTDDTGSGTTVTTPTTTTTSGPFVDRVRGRILLQVEANGEAWYVHPKDGMRYYMKDGAVAYQMMRNFGLGISNADLAKVLAGDSTMVSRTKGRILLQVQAHGEAYYVNPGDSKAYYMKDGAEAYRLMREKSLGITNADLQKISYNAYDAYVEPEKTTSPTTTTTANGSISLTAMTVDTTAKLMWSLSGMSSPLGYKVVKSEYPNPVYPGGEYHYISDPNDLNDVWSGLLPGKSYHFRVCEYLGGACGVYSNDVVVNIPASTTTTANGTLTLSGTATSATSVSLSWTMANMTSAKGFKVVLADHLNPVYPGDAYHYWTSPDRRSDEWTDLTPGKTYHFRVCEYLGGACGVYSNDVQISL